MPTITANAKAITGTPIVIPLVSLFVFPEGSTTEAAGEGEGAAALQKTTV